MNNLLLMVRFFPYDPSIDVPLERIHLGWTPWLRQPNKTLFAVRCKLLDRQDHCTAF